MVAWPIKFVEGSKPAKKFKTDSKLPKKNYEEARGDREWQDGRDWLQYDKERGMTCSWCLDVHNTEQFESQTKSETMRIERVKVLFEV